MPNNVSYTTKLLSKFLSFLLTKILRLSLVYLRLSKNKQSVQTPRVVRASLESGWMKVINSRTHSAETNRRDLKASRTPR